MHLKAQSNKGVHSPQSGPVDLTHHQAQFQQDFFFFFTDIDSKF